MLQNHKISPNITADQSLVCMQDFDTDAADRALEPAFAAIAANLHKQPPSACWGDCSATQLPFFLRYSSAWVYAAMATTGVSLMEKHKQWQQAVDLLQQLLGESCLLWLQATCYTDLSYHAMLTQLDFKVQCDWCSWG